ncbi:hypothetical protein [Pseudomonas sp. MWU12-2345]|uniref:hypothetical protein n=1 Tax=Pseudomonas sp. MWU12-2345 TaxID=2928689 RepID=UPI00200BBABE|nr:hypothetical protein [Pseudomonas sp. MWU12-2345]
MRLVLGLPLSEAGKPVGVLPISKALTSQQTLQPLRGILRIVTSAVAHSVSLPCFTANKSAAAIVVLFEALMTRPLASS